MTGVSSRFTVVYPYGSQQNNLATQLETLTFPGRILQIHTEAVDDEGFIVFSFFLINRSILLVFFNLLL